MIIDCHGHYTTAPAAHNAWRNDQPNPNRLTELLHGMANRKLG